MTPVVLPFFHPTDGRAGGGGKTGGTGADTFNVSNIGPQYQNFSIFNKIGSSTWTLTACATWSSQHCFTM